MAVDKFKGDSLEVLAEKLKESFECLKTLKVAEDLQSITIGRILLAARAHFGLSASRSKEARAKLADFRVWSAKNSGVSWKTCAQYIRAARYPEKFRAQNAAYCRKGYVKRRAEFGGGAIPPSEVRIRQALGILRALTPGERSEVMRRLWVEEMEGYECVTTAATTSPTDPYSAAA